MSLLDNLPHRCRIQVRTTKKDTLGGNREVREIVATNVPCWSQSLSSNTIMMYQKRGMVVSETVYFNYDPKLTERHEIVLTSLDGGQTTIAKDDEQILEVWTDSEPDATVGLGLAWNVVVNRRTGQK